MRRSKYNQLSGVKEKKPKFSLSGSIKEAIRKRDAEKGTGQVFRDSFGRRKAAM